MTPNLSKKLEVAVRNLSEIGKPDSNHLLMATYRSMQGDPKRCRFDMFVRLRPGVPSKFRDQKRTWCFRGDKFTDLEFKMLRNLINLMAKDVALYDVIELYDNKKHEGTIVVKLLEGCVVTNDLHLYQEMLTNYNVPLWLKSQ